MKIFKTLILSLIISISIKPQAANAFDLNEVLDLIGIKDIFNSSLLEIVGIFPDVELEGKVGEAAKDAIGDLGPDLNELETEVGKELNNSAQQTETNDIVNAIQAEGVKTYADAVTGKKGQEATRKSLEVSQEATEELASLAASARNETITQNVMKRIAEQNAQHGVILSNIHTSLETTKQATAYNSRINAQLLKQNAIKNQQEENRHHESALVEIAAMEAFSNYVSP